MSITIGNIALDNLTAGELVLEELAGRIPSPAGAPSIAAVAAGMLAGRARDIHRGFVHALDGPSVIAPVLLGRPLVELAILARWIQDDPQPRFEQWVAHSEANDAKAIGQLLEHLPRPAGDPFGPDAVQPALDAKRDRVDSVRTTTTRLKGNLRPGLSEMITAIVDGDPNEALAMWQAYDLGYRGTSPSTHSEAASFKQNLVEEPDGSLSYIEAPPIELELLRFLAAACFAFAIEAAGRMAGLAEVADTALAVRLRLAQSPAESGT